MVFIVVSKIMDDTLIKQVKHYQRKLISAKENNKFSEVFNFCHNFIKLYVYTFINYAENNRITAKNH